MADADVIPREVRRRHTAIAIVVAIAAAFAVVMIAMVMIDRLQGGPAARDNARTSAQLLTAQRASDIRAECITAYRGEWQNAVGDIVLVASRGNDPTEAQVRALARAQRHSIALNDLCAADRPGGPLFPTPQETP